MRHLLRLLFIIAASFLTTNAFTQIPGNSLRLKADTNYVSINDAASQSLHDTITWEFWIYYRCESDIAVCPITKGWCTSTMSYYITIRTDINRLSFYKQTPGLPNCYGGAVEYVTPSNVTSHNTWTHIALVMSGATAQFYVNGQPVTTIAGAGTPFAGIRNSVEPVIIGAFHYPAANGGGYGAVPKANIDEVRIWHVARTAGEIFDYYQTPLAGTEPGLMAYYKMDETGAGSGITVANSATGSSMPDGITVGKQATLFFDNNNTIVNTSPVCSVMPLQLLTFSAKKENKINVLKWTTANEINVTHFEIERSMNGQEFNHLSKISAGLNSYSFIDNSPLITHNYYRLKIIDKDGHFTYSKTIEIKLTETKHAIIFPNPVTSNATIKLHCEGAERVAIKVVTNDGKVVSGKTYNLIKGENLIPLKTSQLATGLYTITITGQSTNEHLTFSKHY